MNNSNKREERKQVLSTGRENQRTLPNDISSRDLSGEMVSPNDSGYGALIDDIFCTMEKAQELAMVNIRDQKRIHNPPASCRAASRIPLIDRPYLV